MTVAYQSSAGKSGSLGADCDVPNPSGTVAGDLLIAIGVIVGTNTITAPSGDGGAPWNLHANSLSNSQPIWWKIANGTEPATHGFVTSGSTNAIVSMARITGHHPSSPIEDVAGVTNSTTTLTLPSVTSGGANRLLMQMVCKLTNNTWSTASGGTERYDALAATQSFGYAGGDEIVGSGATGTRTWTASGGAQAGVGYNIVIAPSAVNSDVDATVTWSFGSTGSVVVGNNADATIPWSFTAVGDIVVQSPLDIVAIPSFNFSALASLLVGGGGSGSQSDIARFRAANYLGITEPTLSTVDMDWLLREYWGRKAGLVGDLSSKTIMDIISVYFPGQHFIRDVN